MNFWIQFFVSAVVVIWAGSRLTRSAKDIAGHAGISTAWAGVLLLPLVTALPELVTTTRAVTIGAPDLALGNIFGSNLFNLALLAVIDLVQGRGALTARLKAGHILTASLTVIAICFAVIGLSGPSIVSLGFVGGETFLIALVYLAGSRLLFRHEKKNMLHILDEEASSGNIKSNSLPRALLQYLFSAALIVAAGVFLTDAADMIALETGLGRTVVGSLFLAVCTSLPELVTTISAVRLGVLDMAVANVFGANFLNLFIIFWADLLYTSGPILEVASSAHIFSGMMAVVFTSIVIIGLVYRSQRELIRVGYDSLAVIVGYLITVYFLFASGVN